MRGRGGDNSSRSFSTNVKEFGTFLLQLRSLLLESRSHDLLCTVMKGGAHVSEPIRTGAKDVRLAVPGDGITRPVPHLPLG